MSYNLSIFIIVRYIIPSSLYHFSEPSSLLTVKQNELPVISPRFMYSSNSLPACVFGDSNEYFNPMSSSSNFNEPTPLFEQARTLLSSWSNFANTSEFAIVSSVIAPLCMVSIHPIFLDGESNTTAYPLTTLSVDSICSLNCLISFICVFFILFI